MLTLIQEMLTAAQRDVEQLRHQNRNLCASIKELEEEAAAQAFNINIYIYRIHKHTHTHTLH
jgi:uncharacterized coiled-coil protein SlyX